MIRIDTALCTACGECVVTCETHDIELSDSGAVWLGKDCSECGHCVAVCPAEAIHFEGYGEQDVLQYDADTFDIDANRLLNFMKFRRSTRRFTHEHIEKEKIDLILEAGRFSPTACNDQLLRYVVVKNDMPFVRDLLWEGAASYAKRANDTYLLDRYNEYIDSQKQQDALLYGCSHLIFILATEENDACIASSRMELMAHALGLGALYLGYGKLAVEESAPLQHYLGETEESKTQVVIGFGYPYVRWHRTVPRKPLQVTWK